MALVVEDGTGVLDANTYADLDYLRGYASDRGVTLSEDDATLTAQAIRAMDYLDGVGLGLLSMTWPPATANFVCGMPIVEAVLRLKNGQAQLCIEQFNSVDLAPTKTGAFITEDTIGPITTKYSEKLGGGDGSAPDMPAVDALLDPLLRACGQPATFITTRV